MKVGFRIMAIKFKTKTSKKYIWIEAKWDGKLNNDPLVGKEDLEPPHPHPFALTDDYQVDLKYSGREEVDKMRKWRDVVANNEATRALVKMIKSNKSIRENCGNCHPYWYRMKLIGALSQLWD